MKKKHLRANQGEFATKELDKAIMTRSRLRNKYLTEKSADSKFVYDKQRNYYVTLQHRTKKNYFAHFSTSLITDNKEVLENCSTTFRVPHKEIINLVDTILSHKEVVTDTFNNRFSNTVKNLLKNKWL